LITIEDIIAMKDTTIIPFGNMYRWFFMRIEDELISKTNGEERVKIIMQDYDYMAKLYVVHQFMKIDEDLGNKLFRILELDINNTFLEDKYAKELVDII